MNKLSRQLMVKVYQALSVGDMNSADLILTEVRNIKSHLEEEVAALGFHLPVSCDKIDLYGRWSSYFDPNKLTRGEELINSRCGSILDRAKDFARRVRELCFVVFDIKLNEEEIKREEEKYVFLEIYGLTIPLLKLAINVAFCRFWGEIHTTTLQEMYPSNDESVSVGQSLSIFPRRLRVFLNIMSSSRGRRSRESQVRMNSLFQGWKKGLLPCEPELLQKSLYKHKACLTKDPEISSDLDHTLRRMVGELFPVEKTEKILSRMPEFARNQSSSATCDYSYSQGGNVGWCLDVLYGSQELKGIHLDSLFEGHSYVVKDEKKVEIIRNNYKTFSSKLFQRRGLLEEKKMETRRAIQVSILVPSLVGFASTEGKFTTPWPVYSRRPLMPSYMKEIFPDCVYQKAGNCREQFDLDLVATPACILEPMKVRMITKPSLGLHSRMHSVQQKMWRALRDHKSGAFPLIGETLSREHLYKFQAGWDVGSKMCSGDYSAATDNLKGGVTTAITEELVKPLILSNPILYVNILNSLKGVRVLQTKTVLPKWPVGSGFEDFKFDLEDFDQTNGQLMGHVLSFVVLCIANFCCYWLSIEKRLGRPVSWEEIDSIAPVLVNGDDILFRSIDDKHYDIWYNECLPLFGFEPSVGKNFYNDRFCQINSVLFRIDTVMLGEENNFRVIVKDFVEIPYVNFGLLTNRNKQDCTKDCSVQRVGVAGRFGLLTEQGISQDSVIGRVMVLPKIREKLFDNSLSLEMRSRLHTTWLQHTRYLTEGFGLSWALDYIAEDHNGTFADAWTVMFKNQHEPMMDERAAFADLSLKVDRGEISIDYVAMKQLKKAWVGNPFFKFSDAFESFEEEDEQNYKIIAA